MIERDLLFNATLALILITFLSLYPRWAARMGRRGFGLMVCGALLPLVDIPLGYIIREDRVSFLADPVIVGSLLGGLGMIVVISALAAFALSLPRALKMGVWVAAGLFLNQILLFFSDGGALILHPIYKEPIGISIFMVGNPPLLLVLLGALLLMIFSPAHTRWVKRTALALVAGFLLWGVVGYGVMQWRIKDMGQGAAHVTLHPGDSLLTHWNVVVAEGDGYSLYSPPVWQRDLGAPVELARWDNQALLLRALGAPIIYRYYYRVFQHPVVRLSVSQGQMTMLMQELQDQAQRVPGPTIYLESDLSGENRLYQLQRFD